MTKWHRTNEPVFNKLCCTSIPLSNSFWPGLTPFGPLFWQAEAYAEMTKPASPTTAVGQKALALAKRRWHAKRRFSTVSRFEVGCVKTFATIQVQHRQTPFNQSFNYFIRLNISTTLQFLNKDNYSESYELCHQISLQICDSSDHLRKQILKVLYKFISQLFPAFQTCPLVVYSSTVSECQFQQTAVLHCWSLLCPTAQSYYYRFWYLSSSTREFFFLDLSTKSRLSAKKVC